MRKKKIFIAGQVSGLSEDEYTAKFKKAEDYLLGLGYAVYNPADADVILDTLKELGYAACLAKCIAMLRFCDCIYMLKDWQESKDAIAEKAFADAVGIETIYEIESNYEEHA